MPAQAILVIIEFIIVTLRVRKAQARAFAARVDKDPGQSFRHLALLERKIAV